MNVRTRQAVKQDLGFLKQVDTHLPERVLARIVAEGRALMAEVNGAHVGVLRWGMFWDEVPFMNFLFVLPEHRNRGVGRSLVDAWEADQAAAGHTMVLTSTSAAERAQTLYRRLGYLDAGSLLLPGEPTELILRKPLR